MKKTEKPKDINVGSLLRLFKSIHFDTWMAVSYLYQYNSVEGIQAYLSNEFYKCQDEDIEFYLPQLCSLVVSGGSKQNFVFRFLMDKASKSVHFALKIAWMFSALGEPSDEVLTDYCASLRKDTETATMNRRRPDIMPTKDSLSKSRRDYESGEKKEEDAFALAMSQMERSLYFKSVQLFVESVGEISNRLRELPVDQRSKALVKELNALNIQIRKNPGVYVPLHSSNYACIVNIPENEAVMLSSRDRAPFLLILEVLETEHRPNVENIHILAKKFATVFEPFEKETPDNSVESIQILEEEKEDKKIQLIEKKDLVKQEKKKKDKNENEKVEKNDSETSETSDENTPRRKNSKGLDDWVVLESPQRVGRARQKSILFLREKWEQKERRIRKESPFGHLPNWKLQSMIVKYGDDCRQERMALQLISEFDKIFKGAKLPLVLRPYMILVLSPVSCLIETIVNAMSIHQLKKDNSCMTICEYFKQKFNEDTLEYKQAQANFIESTAAYSIVTYLLQLKDRHNGNIMIDNQGFIVHIDFGFMLSNSPGSLNFETSPFKLTQEYIDFMEGVDSAKFQLFKILFTSGFMEVRKHKDKILNLISMMLKMNSKLPCLVGGESILENMKERFLFGYTDKEASEHVEGLITASINNWRTKQYDQYQFLTNGILY